MYNRSNKQADNTQNIHNNSDYAANNLTVTLSSSYTNNNTTNHQNITTRPVSSSGNGFVNSMASRYQKIGKQQQQQNTSDLNISNSEMNATTSFQRQAKGPISIQEIEKDGKFIILENTSRNKDVLLDGWSIKREIDYIKEINFKFPDGIVLRKSSKLKIWAGDNGREDYLNGEIEFKDVSSWGVSRSLAVTTVLSDDKSEKATHIQKTLFSS
jgi:hypothetical protein